MTPDKAPDKARDLLDGTTPAPWKWQWDTGLISLYGAEGEPVATDLDLRNADLIAAAPALASMIAGMHEEWGAERQVRGHWVRIVFALNTLWTDDRAIAESAVDDCQDLGIPARLVHRYVTDQEALPIPNP